MNVLEITAVVIVAGAGLALVGYGAWLLIWDIREQIRSRRLS